MPNGTILLIDDEPVLRQAVARTLELEGYTVRQVIAAMRGLETLRDYAVEILVILSDIKLPAAAASTCYPDTKPSRHWPK